MKNALTLGFFTHALLGFALEVRSSLRPRLRQRLLPPPLSQRLGPHYETTLTQVLPDRRVTFRLFAPTAMLWKSLSGSKAVPTSRRESTTRRDDEECERPLERDGWDP